MPAIYRPAGLNVELNKLGRRLRERGYTSVRSNYDRESGLLDLRFEINGEVIYHVCYPEDVPYLFPLLKGGKSK